MTVEMESETLADSSLSAVEAEWVELAARANASPYQTFGWLESWTTVYRPRRLHVVRIRSAKVGTVALGLLEQLAGRRLRFAGVPVTPVRGLLCAPGFEADAWAALGGWLARRPAWAYLDASGIAVATCPLRHAVATPVPWVSFDLPPTFDDYLTERPSSTRREFRRRLRVAEREGLGTTTVANGAVSDAVAAFVALHIERARSKGEVHPSIDDRLAQMLNRVARSDAPALRLFVVAKEATVIAVAVQLDYGGESWAYNTGFDPAAARLAPGLLVRLASIRDAIERGVSHFDLGPGDHQFKRDLGGVSSVRMRIEATTPSAIGRLALAGALSRRRLREVEWARAQVDAARRAVHRLSAGRIWRG